MTNIYSKQITLESVNEITDWVQPLEKVYARQETQLAQHHQDSRQRDAQAEKADSGVTALNTFKNILDFGKTAVQLNQSFKTAADTKKQNFIKTLGTNELILKSAEAQKKALKDYAAKREDILEDESQHSYLVRKVREKHPEAAAELEKYSTLEQVTLREWHARQLIPTTNEAAFQANLRQPGNEAALEKYQTTTSELEKRGQWIEWQKEQIAYLQLSDEAFAALAATEVRRTRSTAEALGKVQSFQKVATDAERKFLASAKDAALIPETFGTFLQDSQKKLEATGVGIVDQKDHPEGLTRAQQANGILYSRLQRLAYDGDLPGSAIVNGKNQLQYFSEAKINGLVQSLRAGEERKIGFERALDVAEAQRIEASQLQGNDESAAVAVLRRRNLLPEKRLASMENRDTESLSKRVFQQESAKADEMEAIGMLGFTESDLDEYTHPEVKARMKRNLKILETEEKLHGTTENSMQAVIGKKQSNIPWGPGSKLTGSAGQVNLELDQKAAAYRFKLIMAQYDKNGVKIPDKINHAIGDLVETYKSGLWTKEGGGTDNLSGRYSFNTDTMTFSNMLSAKLTEQRALSIAHHTVETHGEQWRQNIEANASAFRKDDGTIDWVEYANSGTAFTADDLVALRVTGEPTEKMLYTMGYTNAEFEALLNASVKTVEKANPGFTSKWGFNKFEPVASEEILKEFDKTLRKFDIQVDSRGREYYLAKDLQYLLKRKRWVNLTDNQKKRVLNTISHRPSSQEVQIEGGREREYLDTGDNRELSERGREFDEAGIGTQF